MQNNRTAAESSPFTLATFAAVALGLALRFYHYARNPAMWHDEAATSVNVLEKSFYDLLGHLDYSATGPSLFLWAQKCAVLALGDSTYALRLLSFVASCAGLLLFTKLSEKMFAPASAFCAVLLAACSDRLLWHASEARHYSSDFLIATVLLMMFVTTQNQPLMRRIALFALLAPSAILFSYPGIFLYAGVMLALALEVRADGRAAAWTGWLLLGTLVGAIFLLFYFVTIKAQRSADMDAAWAGKFPNLHKPWKIPFWAVSSTVSIFDYYARPFGGGLLIVPAIAGGIVFWRENKRGILVLILVPMLCALLLALVKSYPYTGARTMVYALPGLGLLVAAGITHVIEWLRARLPKKVAPVFILLLLTPFAGSLIQSFCRVAAPWQRADTAGAAAYVLAKRCANEPVTSNHWEYRYYFRNLRGSYFPTQDFFNDARSAHSMRVWLVLTSGKMEDRLQILNSITGNGWRVIEQRDFQNTTVFLLSRAA